MFGTLFALGFNYEGKKVSKEEEEEEEENFGSRCAPTYPDVKPGLRSFGIKKLWVEVLHDTLVLNSCEKAYKNRKMEFCIRQKLVQKFLVFEIRQR